MFAVGSIKKLIFLKSETEWNAGVPPGGGFKFSAAQAVAVPRA
jgi:hypothetical protein